MSSIGTEKYKFGAFELSASGRTLSKGGAPIAIGARALDLLIALVERPGQVVSKRELFSAAWPDTHIEDSNLRVNIAALRRLLNDDRAETRYISSVPGRGYSFVGNVEPMYRFDRGDIDPSRAQVGVGYVMNGRIRPELLYYANWGRTAEGSPLVFNENIIRLNIKVGLNRALLGHVWNPGHQ